MGVGRLQSLKEKMGKKVRALPLAGSKKLGAV
jgi:hypothetical protein